jgi:hypothetical protein
LPSPANRLLSHIEPQRRTWVRSAPLLTPLGRDPAGQQHDAGLSVGRATLKRNENSMVEVTMAKRGRKKRARKYTKANHGKRPNA